MLFSLEIGNGNFNGKRDLNDYKKLEATFVISKATVMPILFSILWYFLTWYTDAFRTKAGTGI